MGCESQFAVQPSRLLVTGETPAPQCRRATAALVADRHSIARPARLAIARRFSVLRKSNIMSWRRIAPKKPTTDYPDFTDENLVAFLLLENIRVIREIRG